MGRIAPSERLREELDSVLTRGLAAETGQAELRGVLLRLGVRRMLQELLEAEQAEFIGAGRYERGADRDGRRNGYEPAHIDTGEGRFALEAPQVRGAAMPFRSKLLAFLAGRTETVERLVSEMYARGLSTRDIEQAFTDATGGCVLSKSVVSDVTERLWAEYQAFREQRWDGVEILYLFGDGLYEAMRGSGARDAVLCLWAICGDGASGSWMCWSATWSPKKPCRRACDRNPRLSISEFRPVVIDKDLGPGPGAEADMVHPPSDT